MSRLALLVLLPIVMTGAALPWSLPAYAHACTCITSPRLSVEDLRRLDTLGPRPQGKPAGVPALPEEQLKCT